MVPCILPHPSTCTVFCNTAKPRGASSVVFYTFRKTVVSNIFFITIMLRPWYMYIYTIYTVYTNATEGRLFVLLSTGARSYMQAVVAGRWSRLGALDSANLTPHIPISRRDSHLSITHDLVVRLLNNNNMQACYVAALEMNATGFGARNCRGESASAKRAALSRPGKTDVEQYPSSTAPGRVTACWISGKIHPLWWRNDDRGTSSVP